MNLYKLYSLILVIAYSCSSNFNDSSVDVDNLLFNNIYTDKSDNIVRCEYFYEGKLDIFYNVIIEDYNDNDTFYTSAEIYKQDYDLTETKVANQLIYLDKNNSIIDGYYLSVLKSKTNKNKYVFYCKDDFKKIRYINVEFLENFNIKDSLINKSDVYQLASLCDSLEITKKKKYFIYSIYGLKNELLEFIGHIEKTSNNLYDLVIRHKKNKGIKKQIFKTNYFSKNKITNNYRNTSNVKNILKRITNITNGKP